MSHLDKQYAHPTKGMVVFDEFDQFNAFARSAGLRTQEETRALGHAHVSTEHILLGLLRVEGSVASKALRSFGLTTEVVRAQVFAYTGEGPGSPLGEIPYASWARKVFQSAIREAGRQECEQVTTEHILLSLLREYGGLALTILHDFDIDEEAVQAAVARELHEAPRPTVGAASS